MCFFGHISRASKSFIVAAGSPGTLGKLSLSTNIFAGRGVLCRRSSHLVLLILLIGLLVLGCSMSITEQAANGVASDYGLLSKPSPASIGQIQPPIKKVSMAPDTPPKGADLTPPGRQVLGHDLLELFDGGGSDAAASGHFSLPATLPPALAGLDVASKKRVFVGSLLPVVVAALDEISLERQTLLAILAKNKRAPAEVFYKEESSLWKKGLSEEEINFVLSLTRKYRHVNGAELLERVDVLPVSLILAQSAIESSWGTSRFVTLANNLFGMWTWGEKGIVPLDRDDDKTHKIAAYDSILDSVRAYVLTINRLSAYQKLREMRTHTSDSIILSEGLVNYSERGAAYVSDLQQVIRFNRLDELDAHRLASL